MLLQWCLRGVPERIGVGPRPAFTDADATQAMTRVGLTANWLAAVRPPPRAEDLFANAHAQLSRQALDAHVNNFPMVKANTPYLSLTAGVVVPAGASGRRVIGAWSTAIAFATRLGSQRVPGFVFECWVPVGPKPVPELPGFGEEVRDLNASRQFCIWHREGEIAVKLVVPPRQIRRVVKFDAQGRRIIRPDGRKWEEVNPAFVPPDRLANLRPLVL